MCFDHSDSIQILRDEWRRARKDHVCSDCHGPIERGSAYRYSSGVSDDRWVDWKQCSACHLHAAFIYAIERSEGCAPWESMPPIGAGMMAEDLADRGLHVDDDYADSRYELDEPAHFVARWTHIDAARSGGDLFDRPFTAEVRRRMQARDEVRGG